MNLAAASGLVSELAPWGAALLVFAAAVFTPVYTKRRENDVRRKEKLLEASEVFEEKCDALQDEFSRQITGIFEHNTGYSTDFTTGTGTGLTWQSVATALNSIERSARRIGHFHPGMYDQAEAIHQSLKSEVEAIKTAAQSPVHERPPHREMWEQHRVRSDRLRREFTRTVYENT